MLTNYPTALRLRLSPLPLPLLLLGLRGECIWLPWLGWFRVQGIQENVQNNFKKARTQRVDKFNPTPDMQNS